MESLTVFKDWIPDEIGWSDLRYQLERRFGRPLILLKDFKELVKPVKFEVSELLAK